MLSAILVQFVLRLAFGMAAAMATVSSALVTSGFFRVHLWVIMGLNTFAALALGNGGPGRSRALVVAAAVLSYVAAVGWLYEARKFGKALLCVIAAIDVLVPVLLWQHQGAHVAPALSAWWSAIEVGASGLMLGYAITAMLLGHWYLNTPSMQLAPLRHLLVAVFVMAILRGMISIFSVINGMPPSSMPGMWPVLMLRWLSGILGTVVLTVMTWQTLKIPNTQSATGILYVVVILVFLGELSAQWLHGTMGAT